MTSVVLAASCSKTMEVISSDSEVCVTYDVALAEAFATKAATVSYADNLFWAVYLTEEVPSVEMDPYSGKTRMLSCGSCSFENGQAQPSLKFIRNKNHVVIFWAQHGNETSGRYALNCGDLRKISYKSQTMTCNNSASEAYYGVDFVVNANGKASKSIELKRPVAQVKVGTTAESLKIGDKKMTLKTSSILIRNAPTTFSPISGKVSGSADLTFSPYEPQKENNGEYVKFTSSGESYVQMAMGYLLASPDESANYIVDFNVTTDPGNEIAHTVSNVPLRGNFRTNIVGNLLTASATYTVTFDDEFKDTINKQF